MTLRSLLLLAAGAVTLSSCGGKGPAEDPTAEAERGAKGEVLGGSISDDMLPLERLRSQSPPLREAPAQQPGADSATEADPAGADSATDAADEAAPAQGEAAED